jgi:hypothetical protein
MSVLFIGVVLSHMLDQVGATMVWRAVIANVPSLNLVLSDLHRPFHIKLPVYGMDATAHKHDLLGNLVPEPLHTAQPINLNGQDLDDQAQHS